METTWQNETAVPAMPPLPGDAVCDVVIIGGGMTGTLLAYQLARENKKVIVVDKAVSISDSATVCTTGFLSADIDTDLADLADMFGFDRAAAVWQSHRDAIDAIDHIVHRESIECEFTRVPEYWYATSDDGLHTLLKEAEYGRRAGFRIDELPRDALPIASRGSFMLHGQAKFEPLEFLIAVRERAEAMGARFYDDTEAEKVSGDVHMTVTTNRGTIAADHCVIATYLPIENPPKIFARKGMYISYVQEISVPAGMLPEATYLDDQNPYHYFRIDARRGRGGCDRMIVGGEDRRNELPTDDEAQFAALDKYILERFPKLTYTVERRWTGPILETLDGLPYIGRPEKTRPHLYVATGFSGNGMTYAMTSAVLLSDLIGGRENRYEHIFSPYREITIKGILYKTRDYLQEFGDGYLKNVFTGPST